TDDLREKLKVLIINKLKAAETSKANFLLTNKQNLSNFLRIIYLRSLNLNLLDQETEDKVIALITELEKSEKDPEDSGDENPNSKKPSELPTPQDIPTPPTNPKPDFEKLYYDLLTEMEKMKSGQGKSAAEIKKEILASGLSEEQKEELLRELEGLTNK